MRGVSPRRTFSWIRWGRGARLRLQALSRDWTEPGEDDPSAVSLGSSRPSEMSAPLTPVSPAPGPCPTDHRPEAIAGSGPGSSSPRRGVGPAREGLARGGSGGRRATPAGPAASAYTRPPRPAPRPRPAPLPPGRRRRPGSRRPPTGSRASRRASALVRRLVARDPWPVARRRRALRAGARRGGGRRRRSGRGGSRPGAPTPRRPRPPAPGRSGRERGPAPPGHSGAGGTGGPGPKGGAPGPAKQAPASPAPRSAPRRSYLLALVLHRLARTRPSRAPRARAGSLPPGCGPRPPRPTAGVGGSTGTPPARRPAPALGSLPCGGPDLDPEPHGDARHPEGPATRSLRRPPPRGPNLFLSGAGRKFKHPPGAFL